MLASIPPDVIFKPIQLICTVACVFAFISELMRFRTARRTRGIVVSGAWRTTFVEQSTGKEHQYWFATVTYPEPNGDQAMRTTTLDYLGYRSPLPINSAINLLVFPNQEVRSTRIRDNWMWTLIFMIPAVLFSFAWFSRV